MKFNFFLSLFIMFLLLVFGACKGDSSTGTTSVNEAISMDSIASPGGKNYSIQYKMKIEAIPDMISVGKPVVISFTPQIAGKATLPVPLDAVRGYEIHLIMVNDDLSWFDHRHPGLSDLGSYEQAYTFDKGGIYILYADYKPTGAKDTFQMQLIAVSGTTSRAIKYVEPKLRSPAGPYEVIISPLSGSSFVSGTMQDIAATVTKGGVTVDPNTLGDYLGGKGHLVIISVKDKEYLHVHPSVENGKLVFHTKFPKPGFYRAWIQFQTENIVQTGDFVINAEEVSVSADDSKTEDHTDQH